MKRRDFLRYAGIASAGIVLPRTVPLLALESTAGWRTFDVTTEIEVQGAAGETRVWRRPG